MSVILLVQLFYRAINFRIFVLFKLDLPGLLASDRCGQDLVTYVKAFPEPFHRAQINEVVTVLRLRTVLI